MATDMREGIWVVKGAKPFLAPAWSESGADAGLRVDACVMSPRTRKAVRVTSDLSEYLATAPLNRVAWEAGLVLIVDNRRILHARDEEPAVPELRVLERVLVR
jgi:hypothetical protein